MWANDAASQGLDIRIAEVAPGYARLTLQVQPRMLNGHGICHGGFIFTLADSAFAFACNSFNRRAVAQHCTITFLRPGAQGDALTAEAKLRAQNGRNGIYDVRVYNGRDEVIAEFRGHSREIGGVHVEAADA